MVTVIIPAYNDEDFIEEAVGSVLRQTYNPIDVIVVDDGSTDATAEKARRYEGDLRLISTAHRGASHARNVGASAATGEYLVFLDADDVLGSGAIEGLVEAQEAADVAQIVSVCDWAYLTETPSGEWVEEPGSSAFDPHEDDGLAAWLSGRFFPPCALMWPRNVLAEVGGWDESLTSNQDGDLVMRALLAGAEIVKGETGRSYYRRHVAGNRISARRDTEALRSNWKVLRRVERALKEKGRLENYLVPLGQAYHQCAKTFLHADRELAMRCERQGVQLAGEKAITGSRRYRILHRMFGLPLAKRVEDWTSHGSQ